MGVHRVVHHHVLVPEVAMQVDTYVSERRYRHVVLLVAEGRVHVMAELVVVSKVGRVKSLAHRSAGSGCHDEGGCTPYIYMFHCCIVVILRLVEVAYNLSYKPYLDVFGNKRVLGCVERLAHNGLVAV